jgi:hypothetical protein
MFVALVGYGTGVIATYGNQSEGVIVCAIIVSTVGLTHTLLWQYAWSRRLLSRLTWIQASSATYEIEVLSSHWSSWPLSPQRWPVLLGRSTCGGPCWCST